MGGDSDKSVGTVRGGDGGECGAVCVVSLQKEGADQTALRGGPIRVRCQQCLILSYFFHFAIICHYNTIAFFSYFFSPLFCRRAESMCSRIATFGEHCSARH